MDDTLWLNFCERIQVIDYALIGLEQYPDKLKLSYWLEQRDKLIGEIELASYNWSITTNGDACWFGMSQDIIRSDGSRFNWGGGTKIKAHWFD